MVNKILNSKGLDIVGPNIEVECDIERVGSKLEVSTWTEKKCN